MLSSSSALATFLLVATHSVSALRGVPRKLTANGLHIRTLQDFNWDIQPVDGSPTIDLANNVVQFTYNHSGTLGFIDGGPSKKALSFALYNEDCNVTVAGTALGLGAGSDYVDTSTASEVAFDLAMDVDAVTTSDYYTETLDGTQAEIAFCVRGDYLYDADGDAATANDSVNFHETVIVITVDLMANFTLTSISTNRTAADRLDTNADIDCDATAFFCDDAGATVGNPTLAQGDILQFCVTIDPEDAGRLHIKDVVEADLEQDNNGNGVYREAGDEYDDLVANFVQVGILTGKDCTTIPGTCIIKTQLASKYFTDTAPNPLDVFGVALCAFGSA